MRTIPFLLVFLLFLLACGDDSTPPMGDAGDGDGGVVDTNPPEIVETSPMDGETAVGVEAPFIIAFSEPMAATGTVTVEPGGGVLAGSMGSWVDEGRRVIFSTIPGLEAGGEYTATIRTDFTDRAGNPLAESTTVTFTALDDIRPTVVSSTPEEGALDVSALVTEITVTFSEPMDPEVGVGVLSGGRGTLGAPTWSVANTTVRWPVTGLEYDSVYAFSLEDFDDEAGNRLDSSVYLGDGFLDFRTGADMDPPQVLVASPAEAETGVRTSIDQLTVTFNEPMDVSTRAAVLSDGTTDTTVMGVWSSDRRSIRFAVDEPLAFDASYSLDLGGMDYADIAGNALDEVAYLADGAVDFSTGPERFGPVVLLADPGEGSTAVDYAITPIVVRFNTEMDTTIRTAELTGGPAPVTLTGAWSAGNTTIAFEVAAGVLRPATNYMLDLRGFADAGGTTLNDTHPYLDDGILDFVTADPTGDSCRDPLTNAQAARSGTRSTWSVTTATRADDGGTDSCDSSGARSDWVIAYTKTSADLAGGGAMLKISIASANTSDLNIEVRRDTCEPGAGADQLTCDYRVEDRSVLVDVGPGTYYIWVAAELSTSVGGSVVVEELPAWPEGESCNDPFSTSTGAGIYTAPAMAGEPHVWDIPPAGVQSYDRGTVTGGPGALSCNSAPTGADAVVEYTKLEDASVLEVTVTATNTATSDSDLDVEVQATCDARAAGALSYRCQADTPHGTTFTFSPPAGPLYIWIANNDTALPFPGARVSIREVTVGPGESCGTGRPLTGPGTASVTLDSGTRLSAGSCSDGSDLTWFRYTAAEAAIFLGANAGGAVTVQDPIDGRELGCGTDLSAQDLALIADPGRPVCIGISNSSGIATLDFTEQRYTGIRGRVTDLNVSRALSATGTEISWTTDNWMAATPTTLYYGTSTTVFQIPKAGNARAIAYDSAHGVTSSNMGQCAVTVGEQLFSLEDTLASSTTSRWFRLWDARTFPWSPVVWDVMPMYQLPSTSTEVAEACTYDGSRMLMVFDRNSSGDPNPAAFHALGTSAPNSPVVIGSNNHIYDTQGLAADDEYIYMAGDVLTGGVFQEGIYRLARADLGDPTVVPTTLAVMPIDELGGIGIFVDDLVDPEHLYFRDNDGAVWVIVEPDGATPRLLGPLATLGDTLDEAMVYDPTTNAIFLFESVTNTLGRIVRID